MDLEIVNLCDFRGDDILSTIYFHRCIRTKSKSTFIAAHIVRTHLIIITLNNHTNVRVLISLKVEVTLTKYAEAQRHLCKIILYILIIRQSFFNFAKILKTHSYSRF